MLQRSVGRGHDGGVQQASRGGYGEIGSGVRGSQRSQMDSGSDWRDGASSGDQWRGARGPRAGAGSRGDEKESDYRSGGYGKDSGGYSKGGGKGDNGKGSGKGDKGGKSAWGQQSERYPRETREEPRERHQQELVSLKGRGLGDDDLPEDRSFTAQVRGAVELNFAENYITGVGLSWLLRPVSHFEYLRVIKLHKNNIGDSAADPLVKLCRNSPSLCEMHLSHNQITWVGADKIVPAACERQILKSVEKRESTLWLRLEQNQIEDAKQLFNDWQARGLEVSLYYKDSRSPPKGVVMPYFMSQRTVGLGRSSAHYDDSWDESWNWSAGYSDWADKSWSAWSADEAWGWDRPDNRSAMKGKGKGKGKNKGEDKEADKNSKGKQKGKDANAKGKSSEASGEKALRSITSNKGLLDADLEKFCSDQKEKNPDGAGQLDLALNSLVGGAGFNFLQDFCIELANLTIIKLHKNLLTDDVAPYLARMCSGGCKALRELHLSHNLITRTGAEEIVSAACEARASKDAEDDGEENSLKSLPLWLRLEYNEITEPQTLVDDWKSRKLCIIPYSKGPSRHNLSAGVHLPYFFSQGKPSGYVHSSQQEEKTTTEHKERKQKANDGEKKPTQLKWKPKKKPEAEEEEATKDTEANAEEAVEEEKCDEKESPPKEEVEAPETLVEPKEEEKSEEKADESKEKKEKRKGKKGQRRSADDDADATVFSSGEESAGSA